VVWVCAPLSAIAPWIELAAGLAVGLVGAFAESDSTNSPNPVASWRSDRNYAILYGMPLGALFGFGALISFWTPSQLLGESAPESAFGIAFGLTCWATFGIYSSLTWNVSAAAVQLARKWDTPPRLMRFLDDARERSVLRTVGPVYQFRHARLQDRLAATEVGYNEPACTDCSETSGFDAEFPSCVESNADTVEVSADLPESSA